MFVHAQTLRGFSPCVMSPTVAPVPLRENLCRRPAMVICTSSTPARHVTHGASHTEMQSKASVTAECPSLQPIHLDCCAWSGSPVGQQPRRWRRTPLFRCPPLPTKLHVNKEPPRHCIDHHHKQKQSRRTAQSATENCPHPSVHPSIHPWVCTRIAYISCIGPRWPRCCCRRRPTAGRCSVGMICCIRRSLGSAPS